MINISEIKNICESIDTFIKVLAENNIKFADLTDICKLTDISSELHVIEAWKNGVDDSVIVIEDEEPVEVPNPIIKEKTRRKPYHPSNDELAVMAENLLDKCLGASPDTCVEFLMNNTKLLNRAASDFVNGRRHIQVSSRYFKFVNGRLEAVH